MKTVEKKKLTRSKLVFSLIMNIGVVGTIYTVFQYNLSKPIILTLLLLLEAIGIIGLTNINKKETGSLITKSQLISIVAIGLTLVLYFLFR